MGDILAPKHVNIFKIYVEFVSLLCAFVGDCDSVQFKCSAYSRPTHNIAVCDLVYDCHYL
jgi:hypothetical protein